MTLYKCQFPWASVVSSDTQELDPRISKSCFRFEILWPLDGRENGNTITLDVRESKRERKKLGSEETENRKPKEQYNRKQKGRQSGEVRTKQ